MSGLTGGPNAMAVLQVPASLLHMIPMNLFLGGAILAALLGLRSGPDAAALRSWLLRVLPGAGLWTLATGFLSYWILEGITAPQGIALTEGAGAALERGTAGSASSHYSGAWPVVDLTLLSGLALGAILMGRRASHRTRTILQAAAVLLLACAAILCAAAQNVDEWIHLGTDAPGAEASGTGTPILPLLSGKPIPIAALLRPASSLVPRLAHLVLGAVAVGGMLLALHGLRLRKRDPRYADWVARQGAQWFATITGVQLAVGTWLLIALPHPVRHRFFGGSPGATVVILTGIALAIAVMIVMTHAANAPKPAPLVTAGAVLLAALLLVMTLIREQARYGYLADHLTTVAPSRAPWLLLAAIAGLIIAATGFAAWLWRCLGEGEAH